VPYKVTLAMEPEKTRYRYNSREDLVRNANKLWPGLITHKHIAGVEHWQCNYCFAQRRKTHMFRFGKGNPIQIHCTRSKEHEDEAAVRRWCAKSADNFVPTVTNKQLDLSLSLRLFLHPSAMAPLAQPRAFGNRMDAIAADARQTSTTARKYLGRVLCNGFTKSTIDVTRDFRKRTLQVDPLRQDDRDGRKDRSFYVDMHRQFQRPDGTVVVGTFYSKQCALGSRCAACKLLHKVKSFQDYVYEHHNENLEECGSQRGERSSPSSARRSGAPIPDGGSPSIISGATASPSRIAAAILTPQSFTGATFASAGSRSMRGQLRSALAGRIQKSRELRGTGRLPPVEGADRPPEQGGGVCFLPLHAELSQKALCTAGPP
jgi:hypothetical protein